MRRLSTFLVSLSLLLSVGGKADDTHTEVSDCPPLLLGIPQPEASPSPVALSSADSANPNDSGLVSFTTLFRNVWPQQWVEPLTVGGQMALYSLANEDGAIASVVKFPIGWGKRERRPIVEQFVEAELQIKAALIATHSAVPAGILCYDESHRLANGVPILRFPYFPLGSLDAHLGKLTLELTDREKWRIMRQLAQAVADVHRAGWLHNDIKPHNYLLSRTHRGHYRTTLTDFGLATPMQIEKLPPETRIKRRGTPHYLFQPRTTFRRSTDLPSVKRDLYALMLTYQEFLRGEITLVKPRPNEVAIHSFRAPANLIAPLNPTLSSISFVHFPDADLLLETLDSAAENWNQPNSFYRDFFGPKVLTRFEAEEAGELIARDDALLKRWRKGDDSLGLTEAFRAEILSVTQHQALKIGLE